MDVGAELRRMREERGADLAQVAAATKIGMHHLQALERGDTAALPDEVFVRGFIRAYAAFLGTGAAELLAAYRGTSSAADRTVSEMSRLLQGRERANGPQRRIGLRVGLLAGFAALAAGAVFLLQGQRDVKPLPADVRDSPRASRRELPVRETPAARPVVPAPALAPAPTPAPVVQLPARPPAEPKNDEGETKVTDHGVGSSIQKNMLQGRSDRFAPGSVVWFWTRVAGGRRGDVVRHVWIHEGKDVHSVALAIGSSDWRTQSRKSMRSTGSWAVEARDAGGRVLARDEFECVAR